MRCRNFKTIITLALSICITMCIFSGSNALGQGTNSDNSKVLHIGYCEGESYYEFDFAFYYFIQGMKEYGVIPKFQGDLPENATSRELWKWLNTQDQSNWKVKFVNEAYFSLTSGDFVEMSEVDIDTHISAEIKKNNVDFMITMGTTAGLTIKGLKTNVAFMNFCAADAVKSGIVKSAEVSGVSNAWAQMDTDAFSRSISVMKDILKPKSIGVVYADNEDAYIYSGVDVLDEVSKELGIDVKRQFVDDPETDSDEDMQKYYENITAAYNKLAKEVDVFIMTTSLIEMEDMAGLFKPFYENKVPIYSINSTEDVKYGALLAAESSDYKNVGRFGADMIGRFIKGEKLEELPQIYQTAPYLVINYSVAKKVGYKPSFNMLLSTNKIYNED